MMKQIIQGLKLLALMALVISFVQCDQQSQNKRDRNKDALKESEEALKKEKIRAPKDIVVTVSDEMQRKVEAKRAFQKDLETFILSSCTESNKVPIDNITLSLLSDYKHSYENTQKEDGKSICIHELYNDDKRISRIFYTRTEGGHYGDIISLFSLNKKTNALRQLHLFSLFGSENYDQQVTTEIKGDTFIVTEIENSKTKKNFKTVKKWTLFEDGDIGF